MWQEGQWQTQGQGWLCEIIEGVKPYLVTIACLLLVPVLFYSRNILSYVNTHRTKKMQPPKTKIVVFDLDETLGYFTEISMFWDALENFYGHNLFQDRFFEMVDVFPEVFRPEILTILDTLHKRKTCHKLFIYTNNQGPKSWVTMISDYLNYKNGYRVFDQIIAAWKIRGKQIEPKRTSHDKSIADLLSCTNSPATAEICFIDDLYHPLMDTDNVYYINIKPYRVSIPFAEMATRYYEAVLRTSTPIQKNEFVTHIVAFMKQYNYMVLKKSEAEEKVDRIVSKQLLANLDEFLKNTRNLSTRKKRSRRVKTMRRGVY
jgi:hypothetical protein